jgi:HEAT repeat protein
MIDELEGYLAAALSPMGGDPDIRQRENAIRYLVDHADAAYPRLISLLETRPYSFDAPVIIEMLPRFNRSETIPFLERILGKGEELSARAAGQALGRFPQESAGRALTQALASALDETVIGAADGLLTRGQRAACAALRRLIRHPNVTVRYHVIQTAAKLECLEEEDRKNLAQDSDRSIRELIAELTINPHD